jgi:hypothetical protein
VWSTIVWSRLISQWCQQFACFALQTGGTDHYVLP